MENKLTEILEELKDNPRPKKVKVIFPLSVGPGPCPTPGVQPGSQQLITGFALGDNRNECEKNSDVLFAKKLCFDKVMSLPMEAIDFGDAINISKQAIRLASRVVGRHPPTLFPIGEVVVASILTVTKQYFSSCFSGSEAKQISVSLSKGVKMDSVRHIEVNLCVPEMLAMYVVEDSDEGDEEEMVEFDCGEGLAVSLELEQEAGEEVGAGEASPPSPVFIPPVKLSTYAGHNPDRLPRQKQTLVLQSVSAEWLNFGQPARPGRVPKKQLCGR